MIADADADHQYMIRRSIDDGELAFYHCYNPGHAGFGELVNVAGARWPIEECFGAAKNEVGLDEYQEVKQINIDLTDRPLGVYQHGKERPETGKVVSLSERRPFGEEIESDAWVGYCRNCR